MATKLVRSALSIFYLPILALLSSEGGGDRKFTHRWMQPRWSSGHGCTVEKKREHVLISPLLNVAAVRAWSSLRHPCTLALNTAYWNLWVFEFLTTTVGGTNFLGMLSMTKTTSPAERDTIYFNTSLSPSVNILLHLLTAKQRADELQRRSQINK